MSMEGIAVRIKLVRIVIRSTGDVELAGKLVLIQRTRHPSAIGLGWDFDSWFGRLARLCPDDGG
jgi:hypothetical protein